MARMAKWPCEFIVAYLTSLSDIKSPIKETKTHGWKYYNMQFSLYLLIKRFNLSYSKMEITCRITQSPTDVRHRQSRSVTLLSNECCA